MVSGIGFLLGAYATTHFSDPVRAQVLARDVRGLVMAISGLVAGGLILLGIRATGQPLETATAE